MSDVEKSKEWKGHNLSGDESIRIHDLCERAFLAGHASRESEIEELKKKVERLLYDGKTELAAKDKRIAFLESETTRLYDPVRKFWNEDKTDEINQLRATVKAVSESLEFYESYCDVDSEKDSYCTGFRHVPTNRKAVISLTAHAEIINQCKERV